MRYLILLFIFLPVFLIAQESVNPLEFKEMEHHFGEIKEVDGKVSKRFHFRNSSEEAIKLTEVFVACGCTSPEWPRHEIAPNDTASILITFDPLDRPGEFDKYIRVKVGGFSEAMYLIIKGNVLPRPPGPRDWYPFRLGNLWFKSQNIFVGSIYNDEVVTVANVVYNAGEEAITIKVKDSEMPKFVKFSFDEITVPPKDSLSFEMSYDAKKRKDWGFVSDEFMLKTTDTAQPDKNMGAGAILKERFKTKEGLKVPHLSIATKTYDFGEAVIGEKIMIPIELENTGKKKLKIRKVTFSDCNCIEVVLPQKVLKPQQKMVITVYVKSQELFGWQNRSVTLITNDPKNHLMDLRIEGNIVEEQK